AQRRLDGHAARAANEKAFLASEAARHSERVRVAHGDDLVGHGRVVGAGPEVLADALDEVGAPVATGVHRAGGVRADDVDASTVVGGALCRDILEEAARTRDGAAGPDAG